MPNKFIPFQVIDLNERPTAVTLVSKGIYENATAGTVVGVLRAQDPDANQTHSFTIISGRGKFGRIRNTGVQ